MNKKNVTLWVLYDFANSIVEIVFYLYFAEWLVVDKGLSDFWFNMIFVASTFLLILTAPMFGRLGDRANNPRRYLNAITILTFICFLGASLAALFITKEFITAAVFFLFANYFYQFSFVFYNALLDRIAPPARQGFISGLGQAGNWMGQIAGLLITLPLASGALYLFGAVGRAQTLLPGTLLFFLCALPMLLLFRENTTRVKLERINYFKEFKDTWRSFGTFAKQPGVGVFLLGYFFFNDAILTAQNNFPIFLEQVYKVSDQTKSMLLIGILATSVFGALISGWVSAKLGLRKTLLWLLGSWIVIFILLGLIKSFSLFVGATILMGFLFGSIWTITRAVMVALVPKEQMNYGMSFYTLAERFATFLGPLTWGIIVTALAGIGKDRYRIAVISMSVFVALGFLIVRKIQKI